MITDFLPKRKTYLQTVIDSSFKEAQSKAIADVQEQIRNKSVLEAGEKINAIKSFNPAAQNQVLQINDSSVLLNDSKSIWIDSIELLNKQPDRNGDIFSHPKNTFAMPSHSVFEITSINDLYDIETCMSIIREVYESTKDTFYGCLLKSSSGTFVNPLHPIIAQSQSESNKPLKGTFRIVIFHIKKDEFKKWSDGYKKNQERSGSTYTKDPDLLYSKKYDSKFFNSIISNIGSIVESEESMFVPSRIVDYTETSVRYENILVDKDGNQIINDPNKTRDYLIPVQLVNMGFVVPHYGLVEIKQMSGERYARGMQLSPMLSCNVGNPTIKNSIPIYGSVCTGGMVNDSNGGRNSLNHANLNSPFFRDLLCEGSFRYGQIANQISFSIYSKMFGHEPVVFDLDESMPVKVPEKMSFDDYKKMFDGATLKDYLAYVREIRDAELANEKN